MNGCDSVWSGTGTGAAGAPLAEELKDKLNTTTKPVSFVVKLITLQGS